MRHLDLFSGVGGFALAAQRVFPDHQVAAFCEIDSFCRKVLRKHWPDAPIHEDIRELNGRKLESVELVTGGFPCQPYSFAGVQRGDKDGRALWPEMRRVIAEVRPRWVVAENVPGFIRMGLDGAIADLESEGYAVGTVVLPACAVNAAHRRDRVWIIAYADGQRWGEENSRRACERFLSDIGGGDLTSAVSDADGERRKQSLLTPLTVGEELAYESVDARDRPGGGVPESGLVRVVHGVSGGMDRRRIVALGNAIVPQVAEELFRFIRKIEGVYDAG